MAAEADPGAADDRVDRLFTLPPGAFVAARDALVRTLRGEGERELARGVAGLRRPTLAAWAVNQAVRSAPDSYRELGVRGDALRTELRRAVSGATRADVRGASTRRREQIARLTDLAADHLQRVGADAAAHADEIHRTFDAASADPEAAGRVGSARLSRPELPPSGFGELAGLTILPGGDAAASDDLGGVSDADEADEAVDAGDADQADDAGGAGAAGAEEKSTRRAAERNAQRAAAAEAVEAARVRATGASSAVVAAGERVERSRSRAERERRRAGERRRRAAALRERIVRLEREAVALEAGAEGDERAAAEADAVVTREVERLAELRAAADAAVAALEDAERTAAAFDDA